MTANKIDVHAGVDTLTTFVQADAEFFNVSIENKTKLIAWFKETKASEVKNLTEMYDGLINNTQIELEDLKRHVAFLGLRLPKTATIVDGENVNAGS